MNIDDAAELGARLTVARAARLAQATEASGQLRLLAFLMREESRVLVEFAKGASSGLRDDMHTEAASLEGQAQILDGICPPEQPPT